MTSFKLPNGIKIDVTELVDRVLEGEVWPQAYLNIKNGVIALVPSIESLGIWISSATDSADYLLIEPFKESEKIYFAREFVTTLLVGQISKKKLAEVTHILVAGEIDEFEHYLRLKTDGWIHAWDQYIFDEAYEYVEGWLTENPHVKITEEFEGCDDCEICKAVKAGNTDFVSLKKAFDTEEIMKSVEKQVLEQRNNKDKP